MILSYFTMVCFISVKWKEKKSKIHILQNVSVFKFSLFKITSSEILNDLIHLQGLIFAWTWMEFYKTYLYRPFFSHFSSTNIHQTFQLYSLQLVHKSFITWFYSKKQKQVVVVVVVVIFMWLPVFYAWWWKERLQIPSLKTNESCV